MTRRVLALTLAVLTGCAVAPPDREPAEARPRPAAVARSPEAAGPPTRETPRRAERKPAATSPRGPAPAARSVAREQPAAGPPPAPRPAPARPAADLPDMPAPVAAERGREPAPEVDAVAPVATAATPAPPGPSASAADAAPAPAAPAPPAEAARVAATPAPEETPGGGGRALWVAVLVAGVVGAGLWVVRRLRRPATTGPSLVRGQPAGVALLEGAPEGPAAFRLGFSLVDEGGRAVAADGLLAVTLRPRGGDEVLAQVREELAAERFVSDGFGRPRFSASWSFEPHPATDGWLAAEVAFHPREGEPVREVARFMGQAPDEAFIVDSARG